MDFTNLPPNWPDLPIHVPERVADVLDLLLGERDRRQRAVLVAFCDDEGRLIQPCVIDELPVRVDYPDKVRLLAPLVSPITEADHVSLLLAVGRPDGLSLTDDDHEWVTAAREVCGSQVSLLGVHVVTLYGSRQVAA
jgi:hypothetical protein